MSSTLNFKIQHRFYDFDNEKWLLLFFNIFKCALNFINYRKNAILNFYSYSLAGENLNELRVKIIFYNIKLNVNIFKSLPNDLKRFL